MNKLTNSFKNKKFKHSFFSTIMLFLVIDILIVVNLFADIINIRVDLTKDKLYSISGETKEILNSIDKEVKIYALFRNDSTDVYTDMCKEILNGYSKNKYIKVEYKDPILYPNFANKYSKNGEQIAESSIIVEYGERFRVIQPEDLVTLEMNYELGVQEVKSVNVEPQVSNAIIYVTSEFTPIIYNVSNHQEHTVPEKFIKEISLSNYEFKQLDLSTDEKIPNDCSIIFVTTPLDDWTDNETAKVREYLKNGGSAIFLMDLSNSRLPNLSGLLWEYGIQMGGYLVVEANKDSYMENQTNIIPNFVKNKVTDIIGSNYKVVIPYSQSIKEADNKRNNITISPILTTSQMSYEKSDPNAISIDKETGDNVGVFNLAVAVTDDSIGTKLIIVGESYILDESLDVYMSGGNYQFLISAINWTQNIENTVDINPKTSSFEFLEISKSEIAVISFLTVILIPFSIFVIGLVVCVRRRKS